MKKLILFFIMNTLIFSIGQFGSSFDEDKETLIKPMAVVSTQDDFYILDYFSGKILNYNENMELKRVYYDLVRPNSLVVFNDYLYASEGERDRIAVIDPYNGTKEYIGKTGLRRGEFLHPGELAADGEYLYAVDEYNGRIQVFDRANTFVREMPIPNFKEVKSEFTLSYSIALLNDEVYLLDTVNKKLYQYKNFKFAKEIDLANFLHPTKIYTIDGSIHIYESVRNELVDIKTNEKLKLDNNFARDLVAINHFDISGEEILYINDYNLYSYDIKKGRSTKVKKFNEANEAEYIKPISIREHNKELYILDQVKNEVLVYSRYGSYKRSIELGLNQVTSFDIDENGDLVLFSPRENALIKVDNQGEEVVKLKDYNKLPFDHISWLIENREYEGIVRGVNPKKYEGYLAIDPIKGHYYLLNNNSKSIHKYNVKLVELMEIEGRKRSFNIFAKKDASNNFSDDLEVYNSLTDIFFYKDNLYALDDIHNTIYKLDEKGIIESHTEQFDGLSSIYIEDDLIYVVDSNNFRILVYNTSFEQQNEISLAKRGYIPIKVYKEFLIVKEYQKDYKESYKILNIKDLY